MKRLVLITGLILACQAAPTTAHAQASPQTPGATATKPSPAQTPSQPSAPAEVLACLKKYEKDPVWKDTEFVKTLCGDSNIKDGVGQPTASVPKDDELPMIDKLLRFDVKPRIES